MLKAEAEVSSPEHSISSKTPLAVSKKGEEATLFAFPILIHSTGAYDSSDHTILSRAIIAVDAPGPNVPAV